MNKLQRKIRLRNDIYKKKKKKKKKKRNVIYLFIYLSLFFLCSYLLILK